MLRHQILSQPSARTWLAGLGTAALLLTPSVTVQAAPAPSAPGFTECLQRIENRAVEAGVSKKTASTVLANAQYLERVIELDRSQPEFTTTFADYLNRRVTADRVSRGRALLAEHRELLDRVTVETGVPAAYLVAFWGLETNFGSYFGKMPVPSSLATLACDPRRSDYFTGELIAALKIIDEGAIAVEQMEGSWAGAMGHVQFMPSVFLRYAVDADSDQRRDLWNSVADAMMSAGNFLSHLGWKEDYRWGREVALPDGFNYALADGRRLTLSKWRELGVTDAFGNSLPPEDIEAALVVPAGHEGPAFLAYQNFRVIMGWNRSEFYAIAVGHLADRIAGAGGLQNPPPTDTPNLARDDIEALQLALKSRGYGPANADGILGPATRAAIREFQAARGMIADGYPGVDIFKALNIKLKADSGGSPG